MSSQRLATYFVPATGIDREVITTDICRYLGNDALVKPGQHKVTHPAADGFIINHTDSSQNSKGEPISGYFITAYRALTTVRQTQTTSTQDIVADHRGISGSVDGHQGRLCEMGSRAGEKPDKQGITGWRYLTIARFGRRCSIF